MRYWLQNLAWKAAKWMEGRNGPDLMSRHALYLGLALSVLSMFLPLLNPLSLAAFAYSMFRIVSRNVEKRRLENSRYEEKTAGIRRTARTRYLRLKGMKEYKYFKCTCGATLRVRRGQGEKTLICPKCRQSMTRKT